MYTIIAIPEFEDLEPYNPYTEWCILVDPEIMRMYLEGGKSLYVAVRQDMTSVSRKRGDAYPYDNYGLSLLAIIVKADGEISSVTTRWNSDLMEDERYDTRPALTRLLGQTLPF